MPDPGDSRRLSVRDAAERAGVSMKAVRRAIERGELPGYTVRGLRKVVVLEVDVDAVFALERIEPKTQAAPVVRQLPSRRPAARGSRDALRAIEGRAAR